jgi:methylated-DNA-[protein]-cysteine S-methyltransferase
MKTRERELIAELLGDAPASSATRAWLATAEGRRAAEGHRRALAALDAWGEATARAARRRAPATTPAPVVYVGTLETPVGRVLAAVGAHGVVGVSFERSTRAFAERLAHRHGARVRPADDRLQPLARELDDYFGGRRRRVSLPVDLRGVSPFQRRVLAAARRIPAGRVVSYGELARRIGQPRASRAVGQALGRNPIPIVIPCHRIVAGGGALGGYVGGARVKRELLALEGAAFRATGT